MQIKKQHKRSLQTESASYTCLLCLHRSTWSLQTVGSALVCIPERDTGLHLCCRGRLFFFLSSRLKLCSIDKAQLLLFPSAMSCVFVPLRADIAGRSTFHQLPPTVYNPITPLWDKTPPSSFSQERIGKNSLVFGSMRERRIYKL